MGKYDDVTGFELPIATSLYLSIKLHGRKLSRSHNLLDNFVIMSSSRFTRNDIIQMEEDMLRTLTWLVHPIMPQDCIPYIVNFLGSYDDIDGSNQHQLFETSNYISELILFNHHFASMSPSTLAFATVAIALKGMNAHATNRIGYFPHDHFYPFYSCGVIQDLDDLYAVTEEVRLYLQTIYPKTQLNHDEPDNDDACDIFLKYAIIG